MRVAKLQFDARIDFFLVDPAHVQDPTTSFTAIQTSTDNNADGFPDRVK